MPPDSEVKKNTLKLAPLGHLTQGLTPCYNIGRKEDGIHGAARNNP